MRVSRGLLSAVLAGVLVVGTAAAASAEPVPDGAMRWNPALAGEATGVELTDDALRLAAPPADGTTAENGLGEMSTMTCPSACLSCSLAALTSR